MNAMAVETPAGGGKNLVTPGGVGAPVAPVETRHHARGVWLSFCLMVCGLTYIRDLNDVPWDVHLMAVIIAFVAVQPMVWWAGGRRESMPMFEIISLLYVVYYVTPAYFQSNSIVIFSVEYHFDWNETRTAYLWVFGGICTLNLGHIVGGRFKPRRYRWLRPALSQPGIPVIAAALIVFGLGVLLAERMHLLPYGRMFSFGKLLAQSQMYIGLSLLSLHVYSRTPVNRFWEGALVFGVVASMILGLSSAMLEMGLLPGVIYFFGRWMGRRRFPVVFAAVGILVFVGLNGVKIEHRSNEYYFGGGKMLSGSSAWIALAVDRFAYLLGEAPREYQQEYLSSAMARFDFLHPFQHVISMTPEKIPRYGGETYYYLFLGWIPRMMWADKPTAQEANIRYAIDYEILGGDQLDVTMMGIGHLTEAFVNFGLAGFLLTMFLHGVFYRLLGRLMDDRESIAARAVYLVVMLFFFNGIGSSTAACVYYAVYLAVASLVILRLAAGVGGRGGRGRGSTAAVID